MLKRKKTGSLIVISGPSGSGKGTIIKELLKKNNDLYEELEAKVRDHYGITIAKSDKKA